jgi:hypothetical protein
MNTTTETQLRFDFSEASNLPTSLLISPITGSHLIAIKPNYNLSFHANNSMIGALDWNDGVMKFKGDADESAKVFFDNVIKRYFPNTPTVKMENASKITNTIVFLSKHNAWRRGDESIEMQNPTEIGCAIDDAIHLLREYDELEKENAALRKDVRMLDWLLNNCSSFITVDHTTGEPKIYVIEASREAIHAELKKEM